MGKAAIKQGEGKGEEQALVTREETTKTIASGKMSKITKDVSILEDKLLREALVPMDTMRYNAMHAYQMALQSPDWYIRKMSFAAPTALNSFQEAALVRMEEGWRFYGDLPLSEAESLEWIQCTIRPPVIMTWKMSTSEICRECYSRTQLD